MKNNIKVLFAVALAAILTTSCIDETEPMGGTVTAGQVGQSPVGLSGLVASMNAQMTVYNTLGSSSAQHYDFGYPGFLIAWDIMGNDMATADPYYTWHSTWEENVSLNYEYASSHWFWTWYYKQIFIANSVLTAADPESHEAGIARTYRAMCYLDMARMYEFKQNNYTTSEVDIEGLTVPIVTDTTSMAVISNNPRAKVEDIYAFIESDLLKAEELLADYNRVAKNSPDQTVAQGLLARMYLEKGSRFNDTESFQKAAQYARKVINTGLYAPLTEAEWFSPTTGFNSSTANNAWIWSVNITSEDRVVTSGIVNFTSWMAPEQSFGYSNAIGKSSPQKCIDAKFYSTIPDTDFRKKSWIAPDYSNGDLCIAGKAFAEANLNPYCGIKFRPGQGEQNDYMVAAAVDVPLMRIEEMYLIEAEATGLAGGDGKTLLENFVKTYRDPAYTANARSISDAVYQQKRIEFWGEGITFFDTKRLGKGINRGYEGTNHYDATRFNTNGLAPWYNVCINIREMQSNAALLNMPAMCNPDPSSTVPLWE